MKIGYYCILAAAGIILFQTTAVLGRDGYRPVPGAYRVSSQLLLAEKSGASPANQPVEEKKGTATSPEAGKGDSGKSETKPLKPFTPSEKIKADQVVDFPYDI